MSYTLKRSVSPSGFINSLTIESTVDGVQQVLAEITTLNDLAKEFQRITPETFVPKAERATTPTAVPAGLPPVTPIGAAPQPTQAPAGARTGVVDSVFVQNPNNPKSPLVVRFTDGTEAGTFDKKAPQLIGKTVTYGLVQKSLTNGKLVTNLQWVKEVQAGNGF